jgi:hypothetical protein
MTPAVTVGGAMRLKLNVVRLFILAMVVTASVTFGETLTIGQRLKGYDFERKRVVQATRSIILDFLKSGRMDSLKLAVAYCDSLASPDSSWLSESERYCVYFLCVDTRNLYQLDFYCRTFSLFDTASLPAPGTVCRPRFLGEYQQDVPDNLHSVLLKSCMGSLAAYRGKYNEFDDIWTFWEKIVLQPCANVQIQQQELDAIGKKYPQSPFARLRVNDYREMLKITRRLNADKPRARNATGGGVFAGAGYLAWLGAPAGVFPDPLEFSGNIDMIFNNVLYQFGVDVSHVKMKNDLIKTDTLAKGTGVVLSFLSLNIGHYFDLGKTDYISPLGGIFLCQTAPDNSNLTFDVPFVVGVRLGADYTHVLGHWGESLVGPAIMLSTGILLGDFKRISGSQGNCQLYADLTIGIFGFGVRDAERPMY